MFYKILYVEESIDKNQKMSLKYSQYSDEISDDEIYDDEILYVEEPITQNRKIMLKDTQYSDEISEDEILYVDAPRTQNMPKMS
jgi:hypothetical protein